MWSWRLARIAGIELKIHASFLLVVAFGAWQWAGGLGLGVRGAVFGAILTLLTFASVTLHEFGHALVARPFGIPTKDITLYPIGGVARLTRRPSTQLQEVLIAIAGPAVNVLLAGALWLLREAIGPEGSLGEAFAASRTEMPTQDTLLVLLIVSNVMLAAFNLIPALPMDGGRVLRAVLAKFVGSEKATIASAWIARLFAVAFFIAGAMWNPALALVAIFVFIGAGHEVLEERLARILDGVSCADAIEPLAPRFAPETTLEEAIEVLISTPLDAFAVEDQGRFMGVVTRVGLVAAEKKHGRWGTVATAMETKKVQLVDAKDPLETARFTMSEHDMGYVAVSSGRAFLGLITEQMVAIITETLAAQTFRKPGVVRTAPAAGR